MSKDSGWLGIEASEIPATVTISTAIIVCMSVVYLTCYFRIVGEQFQGFMSTTDYILDSIKLLPIFAIFIVLILHILVTIKVTPTPYGETKVMSRTTTILLEIIMGLFTLFLAARLLGLTDLVACLVHCLMIAAGAWITFCIWVFSHQDAQDFSALTSLLLFISVPAIAFVAALGLQDAGKDLIIRGSGELYYLTLAGDSPQKVFILRNIEKGIISMDTNSDHPEF